MRAYVTDPGTGLRLSAASLRREAAGLGGGPVAAWRTGTRHGLPVLRTPSWHRYAEDARDAYRVLRRWADVTGYRVEIETTAAEARALLAGGLVRNGGGRYRVGYGTAERAAMIEVRYCSHPDGHAPADCPDRAGVRP